MKQIIDIDEDVRIAITRVGLLRIPDEMQKKVDEAIQRGTPIPNDATNGDVIKAMFPNIEVEEQGKDLFIVFNMDIQGTPFYKTWWNAQYQKGGKE